MKRLFQITCVFMLSGGALIAKPQQSKQLQQTPVESFKQFSGKIVGDRVRMRIHPNIESHIVQEIPKGQIFAVVDEVDGYYGVYPSKDMRAYIYRTYVLDNRVEAQHVNVRLHPSTDAPVVAQLNSGDPVEVHASPNQSKWYEISFPSEVTFWVAKEYIENIGPVEYVEKYHDRVQEAQQLLETAELIKQTEFRKEFMEVDMQRLTQNFMKIKKDYPDLEHIQAKAENAIAKLQKEYCDLKINFLETKAGKAVSDLEVLNAKLTLDTESSEQEDFSNDSIQQMPEISLSSLKLNFPESQTDKMKVWEPIELSQFQAWVSEHPDTSLENFYGEQVLNADKVQGIIEPFNTLLKHKPGDFILTVNGQTVAYLYSTHINLQNLVGKKVSLKVTGRDNRNFAFPAYYVLEVQE